jgi:uncharacterized protein YyaL (SSP411 family)
MNALLLVLALNATPPAIAWQPFSDAAFDQAQREHKLVLLDLHATWCHWCHVMDATTYEDPQVIAELDAHYVALKADADAAPELADRYDRWGWPATIVFAADGTEIVKRRGYLPPPLMRSLLAAIVRDPSPGPSVVAEPGPAQDAGDRLGAADRTRLLGNVIDGYDAAHAGWGTHHKLLDGALLELSAHGDPGAQTRARETLDAARNLLDPVWGGMYQYSDQVDWRSPHFEKLASAQATAMTAYARASLRWGRASDLASARAIRTYVDHFLLSPDGAFFTSQDADLSPTVDGHAYFALDDTHRRALGLPHVDTWISPRDNGALIAAVCALADAADDSSARSEAVNAATWVLAHRRRPDGLFAHGVELAAPPALADSLSMAAAFAALANSTGERAWLDDAKRTLRAIDQTFVAPDGRGYLSAPAAPKARGVLARPLRLEVENAELAQLAEGLGSATRDPELQVIGARARRYAVAAALAGQDPLPHAELLLLEEALTHPPLHVVVVGEARSAATVELATVVRQAPVAHLLELWDPTQPRPEGLPEFPHLARPAAFVCSATSCSRPLTDRAQLQARLAAPQD